MIFTVYIVCESCKPAIETVQFAKAGFFYAEAKVSPCRCIVTVVTAIEGNR